jgi:colanic acid biosynthesis glycosyl transferase WcaI
VNLVVLAPHFAPDIAPTGIVMTRIVEELAARGHRMHVYSAYPWYREHRVEPPYAGRTLRHEDVPWGRITRINPFPVADKQNIFRRALSFAGFSAVVTAVARRGPPVDGVLAMSPPLTLGPAGWAVAKARRAPFVFNVQDVFPDVAVELGVLTSRRIIAAACRVERFSYDHADAVTVLSDDLRSNVRSKTSHPERVHVIPNFVDTDSIRPQPHENDYRREFGLQGKTVVMYAGNVGLSQSLDMVMDVAAALSYEESLVFVINGQGAARAGLEERAAGLPNVRFVDIQPSARLPEVLAAADIHLVPLKRGLGRSSVPSKTYSILAAARPLVASVDEGSEVARLVQRSGAGVAVAPDDAEAVTKALQRLIESPEEATEMGLAGRRFVEAWASPAAIAQAYEELFSSLA